MSMLLLDLFFYCRTVENISHVKKKKILLLNNTFVCTYSTPCGKEDLCVTPEGLIVTHTFNRRGVCWMMSLHQTVNSMKAKVFTMQVFAMQFPHGNLKFKAGPL